MTKKPSDLPFRTRLLKKIKQEQAFLSGINTGWTRVQRRIPGQIQWSDCTAIEAQRSEEMIRALTAVLAAIENEHPKP